MGKVIVTDTYLSNIASAIRGKAGTQSLYTPAQMASAITNLPTPSGTMNITSNGVYNVSAYASASVAVPTPAPSISALTVTENGTYSVPSGVDGYNPVTVNVSGGGGGGAEDGIIDKTISGAYTNANVDRVMPSVFMECSSLTAVNFPNVTSIFNTAFAKCTKLSTAEFPKLSSMGFSCFSGCHSLQHVNLGNTTYIGNYAFIGCSKLSDVIAPSTKYITNNAFQNCYQLETISLPCLVSLYSEAFRTCRKLLSVYLLGSSVPNLLQSNVFSSTPISNYTKSTGGVQGSIFVRASLYNSWITATNWSIYSERFVSMTDEEIAALDAQQ